MQADINWKQCADLPCQMCFGESEVINGKVYFGGGDADRRVDENLVYCYNPPHDKWNTLPPLPVRFFGLGRVDSKLVAVGGQKLKGSGKPTNEVYTYDEQSKRWKHRFPFMPTARYSPAVLSFEFQSILLVTGGSYDGKYTNAVEIFRLETSQWYKTCPLPTCNLTLAATENTVYALGGFVHPSDLNHAYSASVNSLLRNVQTPESTSSDLQSTSAWEALTNTPTYRPGVAILAGRLLAVGGYNVPFMGTPKKAVYIYSSSTNTWIYISDLPILQPSAKIAFLSSLEILVIGGEHDNGKRKNAVYKGTLSVKV